MTAARVSSPLRFATLKYLSFTHSAVYLGLLVAWLAPGAAGAERVLGWAHGIGWIVISLLCIAAVRVRAIPLWLAVTVAVIGGIGPFAGSVGFVLEDQRRKRQTR